ncbi:peptidylprolyl isomerase [Oceanobacillus caeni]|uniref:peptidylprolyl isomerase n=1 Tax=Oceanobacillus caeni TaxID=405946 RepID=A0ABR5MJI5_9BACI|nr:peptidylprolyl isomerase [Oceanobacillus caeni]KPH75754.1 protein secretion protein [Oceanobacillus caeni]
MSKRLLISIIVVLLITNIATLVMLNQGHQVAIDSNHERLSARDVVAEINGEEITYIEWINSLINRNGKSQLKTLINQEVVHQLADQYHIEVDEKIIKRDISLLTSMQGIMTKEEAKRLERDLRNDIIYRYQLERLLAMDHSVTEEEVQTYYQKYKSQYNFSEAMQISHILVDNARIANKVKKELDEGATFSLLAKEYSKDKETRSNGGYIGFIHTKSQFFPNGYESVARTMNEHSYSEPFQTENGVAIIYLHRKLPSIEFSYEESKPYIESELALEQLDQTLSAEALWEKLNVKWIYD